MIDSALLTSISAQAAASPRGTAACLESACTEFGITDRDEVAAFLAQCAVESSGFCRLSENLNYTTAARLCAVFPSRFKTPADAQPFVGSPQKIANRVYAGKIGNGDEASGDGWRFRGRGYKQLTGRANYAQCLAALGASEPDYLLTPEGAARSAAWFWASNKCGDVLRARGFDAVTRVVNGPGMLGADLRRAAYERAKNAMG